MGVLSMQSGVPNTWGGRLSTWRGHLSTWRGHLSTWSARRISGGITLSTWMIKTERVFGGAFGGARSSTMAHGEAGEEEDQAVLLVGTAVGGAPEGSLPSKWKAAPVLHVEGEKVQVKGEGVTVQDTEDTFCTR